MRVILVLLLSSVSCIAQVYPRWFIDPANLGCNSAAEGFVTPSFNRSSTDSVVFVKACENLARRHYIELSGGESYWETEAGVYWMDNDFKEAIDSSYLSEVLKSAKKVASYSAKDIDFLLVATGDCTIADSLKTNVRFQKKAPSWVESIPQTAGYVYALGVAPQYFYETSSWESAEKKARFNVARSLKVTLKAMQKVDQSSGQEIRSEDISVVMSGFEIVSRWRDPRQGLYFVLARAPSGG